MKHKYKVIIDGDVEYTDDYKEAVESVAWHIFHAREYNTDHNVVGEVIYCATGEVMHREEYRADRLSNIFGVH